MTEATGHRRERGLQGKRRGRNQQPSEALAGAGAGAGGEADAGSDGGVGVRPDSFLPAVEILVFYCTFWVLATGHWPLTCWATY
jgi:hypothetical protein